MGRACGQDFSPAHTPPLLCQAGTHTGGTLVYVSYFLDGNGWGVTGDSGASWGHDFPSLLIPSPRPPRFLAAYLVLRF